MPWPLLSTTSRAVAQLSEEFGIDLRARTGIHLGEVILRRNPARDVARGAKPLEVEGLAKPITGRIMALAPRPPRSSCRARAFDLARRAAVGGVLADPRAPMAGSRCLSLQGARRADGDLRGRCAGLFRRSRRRPIRRRPTGRSQSPRSSPWAGDRPVQQPIPERPPLVPQRACRRGRFW